MSKRFFPLLGVLALLWACGTEDPAPETMADLTFTTVDGDPLSLYEDVLDASGNKVLLLTSVAGWCQPCIQEQADLKRLHREYGDKGLTILAAIFETNVPHQKPSLDYVKNWTNRYELPYQMVLDGDFVMGPYFQTERTPPLNILVRAEDRQILLTNSGFDEQLIRSIIEANL